MNRKFYDNEREIDLAEQKSLHKRSKQIVIGRTIIFIMLVFCLAAGYDGYSYCYEGSIVFLLVFIKMVKYHEKIHQRREFLKSRLAVHNSYISRAGGTWRKRSNDGSSYLKSERPQDVDLYIFGPGSIFQYICAARTKRGRDRLADSLSPMPPKDFRNARFRQKGVAELLTRPRLSLDLEAYARLLPDNHDTTELIEMIEKPMQKVNPIFHLRFLFLPLIIIVALLTYYGIIDNIYIISAVPMISLLTSIVFLRKTSEILKPLQIISTELRLYKEIFNRIEEANFNSTCLSKIREALTNEISASEELQRLSILVDIVNTRRNPVFFILGNAIFLIDFHCVMTYLKLSSNAAKHLRNWIDAWSEMEVLLSLASI